MVTRTGLVIIVAGALLGCVAGAAGIAAPSLLAGVGVPGGVGVVFGAQVIAAAFMGFALALLGERQMSALCARLRESLDDGEPRPIHAASWLAPVAEAAGAMRDALHARGEALRLKLREVEIRHRLSEAERDHAETILDSLRDAVIVTDAFNEVSAVNDRASELLGIEPESSMHRPVDEVVGEGWLGDLIKEVRSSGVPSKQKHLERELACRETADGRVLPSASLDVTLTCLPDGHGTGVGGVVTILRDVTREREIAQMKSDFVSQASHELRTPLSSINAYVEMLLDAEAQDEASRQEFYQIIQSEAERVSRMVDNMLNISRIEAGIQSVEPVECDFVAICRDVVETLTPQADMKQIKMSVKSGPLVYTAQADRDMMHQVVMNLVSNAIKYTPEGGRVTVSVENDDAVRSVLVSVQDTGLGIPPDALDRIFDKFYRIENYKRVAKGTGLGLNLARHIVETMHHGQINVSSEMGMGSRFWFTIPYDYEGAG